MTEPSWHDPAEPGARNHRSRPGIHRSRPVIHRSTRNIRNTPGWFDPSAPYGRHPVIWLQPYSDKSKTIAGLLQLLSLIGIGGIGRFYIGDIGVGVAQLLVGWLTCGVGLNILDHYRRNPHIDRQGQRSAGAPAALTELNPGARPAHRHRVSAAVGTGVLLAGAARLRRTRRSARPAFGVSPVSVQMATGWNCPLCGGPSDDT